MASWSVIATREPELAQAGRRLLEGPDGVAVAYLATAARDSAPRVAPVCPIFALDDLYVCATTRSPKRRDLERDGRFCLHAALGANDEEFQVSGRAQRVLDAAEITSVHAAIRFTFHAADPIFRLDIARCLHACWINVGQPGTRAVRRRWIEAG